MQLNEIYGNRHQVDPNPEYNGDIDPEIANIEGTPYTMFVNEADPQYDNGITFAVSSDEDEGVVWEVDLGSPKATEVGQYVDEPDTGTSGWDNVSWKRDDQRHPVRTEVNTSNEILRNNVRVIQSQLSKLDPSDRSNFEASVTNVFNDLLNNLNN